MRVWWFGCETKPNACGHELHAAQAPYYGREAYEEHRRFPFSENRLDTGFAPRTAPRNPRNVYDKGDELPQGQARLTHIKGWTVVSFWDRTGDSRSNSNTAFVFDERLSGDDALRIAREKFPRLFARFTFEVRIVDTVEAEQ